MTNVRKEPPRRLEARWGSTRRLGATQVHELGQQVFRCLCSNGRRKLQVQHALQTGHIGVRQVALIYRRHDGGEEASDLGPPCSVALEGSRKEF